MIADPLAPQPKVDVTEGLGARPTATSVDAPPLTSAAMEPRALALQSAVPTASASPMPVAAQVSSALSSSASDVIELTLQPEELGRVRLSLNPSDAGISVAVTAERAETLDLIRRHLDQLSQDLRQQGYRDVRFEFGQNMQDHPQSPPNPQFQDTQEQPSEPIYAETVPQSAQVHLNIGVSTGVDIRL
ncbi:flagellar hook-length control protein FliK [Actibacterium mucosum]|nr:flagellar hook-length control protein FliK [Actibacterium mucosum]